jgi:hypothetical protein
MESRQILVCITLSAGVFLVAGCLRTHSVKSVGQYRLDSQSDMTLLLPPDMKPTIGTTQTTKLDLGDRLTSVSPRASVARCSIHGGIFALLPEESGKGWEFQAPSVSGWNSSAIYEEADHEWEVFLRKVEKLASDGCFAKGMGMDDIRRRLVEAMPIPANEVLRFYYSLGSFGFVDLHPGMQIRIETAETADGKKPAVNSVLFSIEDRSPVGVKLALASSRKHLRGNEKTMASEVLSKFADYPLLRLFLEQGTTSSESARHSILVGAKTPDNLDQMSDCILRKGERGCDSTGSPCTLISDDVISLLSTVIINGHPAFYAPGTTLSQILDENTAYKPGGALQTVTIQRHFGARYATVLFPRTREIASKLILINGDRIEF